MVKINLITVMRLLLWSLILVECNRVPVRSVGDNPTPVQPDLSAAYPDSMVYVPAGTFSMGVPANQADDNLGHLVYLDAYYIQRDEVTNEQYATFLNEAFALGRNRVEFGAVIVNGIEALDCTDAQVRWTGERFEVESGKRSHPMIEVTWFGAQAYAEYYGMRLPTEAEWEKAARGTDQRKFPWGNSEPTSLHGNINNVIGETTPVGFFSPVGDSPYGCTDMAGNVAEWCEDWYSLDAYSLPDAHQNPRGPQTGEHRVARGGSFYLPSHFAECAHRFHDRPDHKCTPYGFRCVKDISDLSLQ